MPCPSRNCLWMLKRCANSVLCIDLLFVYVNLEAAQDYKNSLKNFHSPSLAPYTVHHTY